MKRILFASLLSLISGSCEMRGEDRTEVEPLAAQRACKTVDECIVVNSSCNGCCQRAAVNGKHSADFEKLRANLCSGYSGGICDCAYLPVEPVCENSKCGLVRVSNP